MNAKNYLKAVARTERFIRLKIAGKRPHVGIILGSGLSKAVPLLSSRIEIPYHKIPGFPKTTVAGHLGRLVFGEHRGVCVVIMQGRLHYYEGHSLGEVVFPLRVLKSLGIESLLITAAVGSLNPKIKPGDVVVINDHLNLMGHNPMRGLSGTQFGTMFPDLSLAYSPKLSQIALSVCRRRKIRAHSGVYVAVSGPSYETPAEVRAFRKLGGDVVGMSVIPEAIVAAQMGLKTAAVTWVSNMGSGLNGAILSHADVLSLGEKISKDLVGILGELIAAA
jgi:purine-nucleoside phosphorylase